MALIPKVKFPNVPKLPGVPQLVRATTAVQTAIMPVASLGLAAARLLSSLMSKPMWGVYKYSAASENPGGAAQINPETGEEELPEVTVTPRKVVVQPDSIARVGYAQEWSVTTAPVQESGFATYNKVWKPMEVMLRMTKGGSLAERQKFIADLEAVAQSTDLYRIDTPERIYQPVNVTGVQILRDGGNAAYFLAEVDVTFVEVREVSAEYSTAGVITEAAKDPSARATVNQGSLNVTPPTSRVQSAVNKVLAPLKTAGNLFGSPP